MIGYTDISSADDRHAADSRPLGSDGYVYRVITANIDLLSTDMSTECRSTGRSSVNHTRVGRVSIAGIARHSTAGAFSTHDPNFVPFGMSTVIFIFPH